MLSYANRAELLRFERFASTDLRQSALLIHLNEGMSNQRKSQPTNNAPSAEENFQ